MAASFDHVAQQALKLSASERVQLAKELLHSLEPEVSGNSDRAWEEEIERRIARIDSGEAIGRSWEAIKEDFDSRYRWV